MNDMEQNFLAGKMLRLLRSWIDAVIPEETKNCIRSKVAIIVSVNPNSSYNVILTEDYGDYFDLIEKRDSGEITIEEFKEKLNNITIDNLFTVKNETYNIDDYVIIGYLDNKLTNAFILCKNRQ